MTARTNADDGRLPVERYEITDLETGEISECHLAGDVVVAASGIDLTGLDAHRTSAELGTGSR